MPYKKELAKKRRLSPSALAYLTDDQSVDEDRDFTLWSFRHGLEGFGGDPKPDELWREHGGDFLPEFILKNPGKRPLPWWQWDAPRHDTGTGAYFEPLPIPRQRIGGKGETTWEKHPAVVPSYDRGLPTGWNSIDENDPPCFESEASYLDRHGLLTVVEIRHIEKHPELLKPIKIEVTETEEANDERT